MDELWGRQSALAEAAALCRMIGAENTVEELRKLITVLPRDEEVLRAYVVANPEDAWWVERSLKFRGAVLEEFERLVRDGVPDAEPQEAESDSFEDAVSLPCQNLFSECSAPGEVRSAASQNHSPVAPCT